MNKKFVILLFFFITLGMLGFLPKETSAAAIVNNSQIYTYEVMEKDIKELAQAYPELISFKVIGKSEYGRNIYAVSLGKGSSVVQLNGSHHAREWMTTMVNMNMLEQYAKAYKSGSSINGYNVRSIINNSTIWFVPMLNPDGVTLQQFGLKKFPGSAHDSLIKANGGSKDFRKWKANGKGIDLNRQYDANWKNICCNPGRPYYQNYKGPKPNYAKETIAMVNFIRETDPEIVVSYHSSGQILFWHFHQSGSRFNRDYTFAKKVGNMTGYSLVKPRPNPSGGGLTDWFVASYKRPAVTVEIAPYTGQTSVPLSLFPKVWRENIAVGLLTASEGHKLYLNKYASVKSSAAKKVNDALLTSKKLRPYHTSQLRSAADVKINSTFISLYNKTGNLIKTAEAAMPSLTKADRDHFMKSINEAKNRRSQAAGFIDAVKIGDALLSQTNQFNALINQGVLDDSVVGKYNALSSSINKTERVASRVYGSTARKVVREKYIHASKIAKESIIYEVSRYQLLSIIEGELNKGKYSAIQDRLSVLERLEKRSVQIKADGNKVHPGKYPNHPAIEMQLTALKQRVYDQFESSIGDLEQIQAANEFIQEVTNISAEYETLTASSENEQLFVLLTALEEKAAGYIIDRNRLDASVKSSYEAALVQLEEAKNYKKAVEIGEEMTAIQQEIEKLKAENASYEVQTSLYNEKLSLFENYFSALANENVKSILLETYK